MRVVLLALVLAFAGIVGGVVAEDAKAANCAILSGDLQGCVAVGRTCSVSTTGQVTCANR